MFSFNCAYAQAPTQEDALGTNPTKTQLLLKILDTASSTGVSARDMIDTIQCESNFNPRAVSPTHDYGLSQINHRAHPEVTYDQAYDPAFAIQFMAHAFKEKHQREWACFNKYH